MAALQSPVTNGCWQVSTGALSVVGSVVVTAGGQTLSHSSFVLHKLNKNVSQSKRRQLLKLVPNTST